MADIHGTAGADNLNGSTGNDRIFGGGGDDVIAGGDGSDQLHGEDGDDTLSGGNGLDTLSGGEGNDRIDGGPDNDLILADPGDDVIEGGWGWDSINFAATGHGVTVDLGQGIAIGEGTDTLSGIERVHGSDYDDVLTGDWRINELRGGGGSDRLSGGEGSDSLYGGGGDAAWLEGGDFAVDWLDGGAGNDGIRIGENDHAEGGPGVDALFLFLFAPTTVDLSALWSGGTGYNGTGLLTGIERVQQIVGSSGADTIILGTGGVEPYGWPTWPHADGAGGDDRLTGGGDDDWLVGAAGDDVLLGLGGDDDLSGRDGNDRLEGGDGDDLLHAGPGSDILIGGPGSDTYAFVYLVDSWPPTSIFEEDGAAGWDKIDIYSPSSSFVRDHLFTGLSNIEVAELGSASDLGGPEFVLGAEFQASGIRRLIASADIVAAELDVGLDILVKWQSYRKPFAGVPGLSITSGSADDVFYFDLSELTVPNAAAISLDGGAGTDRLSFATAAETAWLFSGAELGPRLVLADVEAIFLGIPAPAPFNSGCPVGPQTFSLTLSDEMIPAGGRLTIDARALRPETSVSYADQLALDASALTGSLALDVLAGPSADAVTGGGGDDSLFGGDGDDALDGGSGDDRVEGEAGDDSLDGGEGHDMVEGGAGDDSLTGGAGDDRLDGGDGADRLTGGGGGDELRGGGGDDVYVVEDAGDVVIEADGAGTDTIESAFSYALAGPFENLVLTGVAASGTGNAGNNVITGNEAANLLNGGAGADTLRGLGGDDVYVVDLPWDVVVETAGMGVDTVRSNADHILSDHVENLVLTGGGHHDGIGNGLANHLTGNNGNNRLDGRGGADTMAGGAGHDVYVVNNVADQVIENGSSGNDSVESAVSFRLPVHVEKLILTGYYGYDARGNAGDNTIIGNSGWNLVSGGSGNDVIDGGGGLDRVIGGAGQDSLKGGAGADRFYFNMAPGTANADRILDFATGEDSLWLIVPLFGRAGPSGVLAEAAFHAGAAAADADDRILYDAATGRLFYDADGTGAAAASLFATLVPGTALSHADIHLYG